jgi:hypothetical protein
MTDDPPPRALRAAEAPHDAGRALAWYLRRNREDYGGPHNRGQDDLEVAMVRLHGEPVDPDDIRALA